MSRTLEVVLCWCGRSVNPSPFFVIVPDVSHPSSMGCSTNNKVSSSMHSSLVPYLLIHIYSRIPPCHFVTQLQFIQCYAVAGSLCGRYGIPVYGLCCVYSYLLGIRMLCVLKCCITYSNKHSYFSYSSSFLLFVVQNNWKLPSYVSISTYSTQIGTKGVTLPMV